MCSFYWIFKAWIRRTSRITRLENGQNQNYYGFANISCDFNSVSLPPKASYHDPLDKTFRLYVRFVRPFLYCYSSHVHLPIWHQRVHLLLEFVLVWHNRLICSYGWQFVQHASHSYQVLGRAHCCRDELLDRNHFYWSCFEEQVGQGVVLDYWVRVRGGRGSSAYHGQKTV
jgi:hypothetical protein